MNDVIKKFKFLEESGLLIKCVNGTIKSEAKEQKTEFFCMLLGTLGANSLENMLVDKGAIATRAGKRTIRAGEGTVRASQDF